MAIPIKDTPTLKGKDAEVFRRNVQESKRIKENFNKCRISGHYP